MRALVVYESMFGSTEVVARQLAAGLGTLVKTSVVEVSEAPTAVPGDVDLLVVAAPTHAMSLSRPSTRAAAAKQSEGHVISSRTGVREWLAQLEVADDVKQHCSAAAVDTRLARRRPPGSAARRIQTRLWRKGLRVSAVPETFWVGPTPGELLPGEADRAHEWGERLAKQLALEAHQRSWEHDTRSTR